MDIFVFSSETVTNIWAGIGAHMWAVSDTGNPTTLRSRLTKSKKMRVGSFGILYCNETHSLTTPFIVYSAPKPDIVIDNVWAGKWVLPFKIFPRGDHDRPLTAQEAIKALPIFKKKRVTSLSGVFHIQAVTAFSPTKVDSEDWEILMNKLVV